MEREYEEKIYINDDDNENNKDDNDSRMIEGSANEDSKTKTDGKGTENFEEYTCCISENEMKILKMLYQNINTSPYSARSAILDSVIEESPYDKIAEYDSEDFLIYELNDELKMIAEDLEIEDFKNCSILIMSYAYHVQKKIIFNGIVGPVITEFDVLLEPSQYSRIKEKFLILIFAIERLIVLSSPIIKSGKKEEKMRKIKKFYTWEKDEQFEIENKKLTPAPGMYIVDDDYTIMNIKALHHVINYIVKRKEEEKKNISINISVDKATEKYIIFMPPFAGKTTLVNAVNCRNLVSDKMSDNPLILLDNMYEIKEREFICGIIPSSSLIADRIKRADERFLENIVLRVQLFNFAYHVFHYMNSIDRDLAMFVFFSKNDEIRMISDISDTDDTLKVSANGIRVLCYSEKDRQYIVTDQKLIDLFYEDKISKNLEIDQSRDLILEIKRKIKSNKIINNDDLLIKVFNDTPNEVN